MEVVTQSPMTVKRIISQSLDDKTGKVFWLSRHNLTEEQKQIIWLLHGDVLIEHHRPYYLDHFDFISYLKDLSLEGFAYAVVPIYFIDSARQASCRFGTFVMNRYLYPYPKLVKVLHYSLTKVQTVFRLPRVT